MKRGSKKASRKQASRQLRYIVLGFAVGLAGLTGLVYVVVPGREDLGSPAIGGSFTMIGGVFRLHALSGLLPAALFDISAVFMELGPDKKVAALFVTVDPERDTPDILKAYLENFDSRMTGDPSKTEAIAKAFRVYAKKV